MKKIIAVILALTLSLTVLAACKKTDAENSGANNLPKIKISSGTKEFKNAEGKVAYKVDYSVPELTTDICDEFSANAINNYINEFYLSHVFSFAENNVQNFRAEETEPRALSLAHEIKYQSENVLSVIFKTSYSKASTIVEARTFNLTDGSVISYEQLVTGNKTEAKEILLLSMKDDAKFSLSDKPLTDEQLSNFDSAFDPVNIYFTTASVTFVVNKSSVIKGIGAGAGVYEYSVDWNTAPSYGLVALPDELFPEETTAA